MRTDRDGYTHEPVNQITLQSKRRILPRMQYIELLPNALKPLSTLTLACSSFAVDSNLKFSLYFAIMSLPLFAAAGTKIEEDELNPLT